MQSPVDPKALLEGLFAFAPVGLQIFEASGRSLLVNQAFRDLFGAAPPRDYCVLTDEIAEKNGVLDLIRRAFEGETVNIPPIWYDPRELRRVKIEEGNRVAVGATFFPLRDPARQVTHVVAVFRDVTTELMAREQAETERDLLRAVIEQSGDGILVCDEEGMIRGLNAEAERQHGVGRRKVTAPEWVQAFDLTTLEGQPLPLRDTALNRAFHGEKVRDARWRVRRPDGTQRILIGTASPLHRADGSTAGAVMSTRDETEQLRLEDGLREETRRAQELARVKDEFLATVSHELRTPLQAILGWARLLHDAVDPQRLERGLTVIERNASLQAQLVDDILDASRIVAGGMQLEWGPADVVALARAGVERAAPTASAKGVSLQAQLPKEPVVVAGDADRLQQVLWNLINNAVRFTPSGGLVEVILEKGRDNARLEVRDSGPGIDAAFLPHVFDPFRQADGSTTRTHGGLGVGLAIVRHLVHLHGGAVEVDPGGGGRGATFRIVLPLANATALEHASTPRPRVAPAVISKGPDVGLQGLKILVIDDEVDAREYVVEVLVRQGAEVVAAASAPEGLEAVRTRDLDLVICDIGMPGEDGFSFIARVRQMPAERGGVLPVIALTAHARAEDRQRVLEAGFQVHVPKPIAPGELVAVVASVAGRL